MSTTFRIGTTPLDSAKGWTLDELGGRDRYFAVVNPDDDLGTVTLGLPYGTDGGWMFHHLNPDEARAIAWHLAAAAADVESR